MEALILSCSTGGGHNAAANAAAEALNLRGHNVRVLDPYTLVGKHVASAVGGTYVRMVQISPTLFGVVYKLGDTYRKLPIKSPVYAVNRHMAKRLARYFAENKTDVVLCTHVFPAEMLSYMKNSGMNVPKIVFIATDYTCIPFTEETNCDYYATPSPDLNDEYIRCGVPEEKLVHTGIPVKKGFREDMPKQAARRNLGLDPKSRYIILSGGSIGAGKLRTAIRVLEPTLEPEDKRLIVLCGNNSGLFGSLSEHYADNPRITVLPSTGDMPTYLHACDIFIGKPGGLSSTECASARVPTIFISPIPGCETQNSRFFAGRGMALTVRSIRHRLIPAIKRLESDSAVSKMRRQQEKYISGRGAEEIADLCERIAGERN